jgi:23S rRNA (cytosine1962-C5)-methyltransferase
MKNSQPQNQSQILVTPDQADYELLDSGDGMKLERYGNVTLSRHDPQALWSRRLPESEWNGADARYVRSEKGMEKGADKFNDKGNWVFTRSGIEDGWHIKYDNLTFRIKPTPFKHTGLFQEQLSNWRWVRECITKARSKKGTESVGLTVSTTKKLKVLNLFGYTGGATLSLLSQGVEVTHVDASKSSIAWAKENAELSGLSDKPVRWILDDAFGYVKREVRRGARYDGIIMDPPAFGRGAKGEVWRIEQHFIDFFQEVIKLLSDEPLFVVINGYSSGYSHIAYQNNLLGLKEKYGGNIDGGELVIKEKAIADKESRLLPCGIVGRWSR